MHELTNNNLNAKQIISALVSEGLVLISKKDLEDLTIKAASLNVVDNRVKYISHKEVISMYSVTDYWLKNQREEPDTLIVCIPGKSNNTAWKYQIQSIENELDRLSV